MRLAGCLCLLLLLLAGCGGSEARAVGDEVSGSIVELRPSAEAVESFTIQSGSEQIELFVADDVDYGFDLRHLDLHRRDGLPIRCEVERRDGRLYALTIVDV